VLLDDRARVTNPGYSLYGRMRGLAELRGVERAVRALGVVGIGIENEPPGPPRRPHLKD